MKLIIIIACLFFSQMVLSGYIPSNITLKIYSIFKNGWEIIEVLCCFIILLFTSGETELIIPTLILSFCIVMIIYKITTLFMKNNK